MSNKWLFAIILYFQLNLNPCLDATFIVARHVEVGAKGSWSIGRYNACPRLRLRNGKIRIRGRGRIAKFVCLPTFEMVGKRFATCVRGQWTNLPPVCVAPGCVPQPITNGYFISLHQNAFLNYFCDAGYKLTGSTAVYCDGQFWNSSIPTCSPATQAPSLSCDFESTDLCGWSHVENSDFTWTRHNFATPSGHVGTGPSHDHTLGEGKDGHYMYIEGSSPRKENDTARLISPVYTGKFSNCCFIFWYHMYGATTGFLLVSMKTESQSLDTVTPSFYKAGDQGNKWHRGVVPLTPTKENFQIVVEGIRGVSYVSDTAIDDVMLTDDPAACVDDDDGVTTASSPDITTTQIVILPDSTPTTNIMPPMTDSSSTKDFTTFTSSSLSLNNFTTQTYTIDTTTPQPSPTIQSTTPVPTTDTTLPKLTTVPPTPTPPTPPTTPVSTSTTTITLILPTSPTRPSTVSSSTSVPTISTIYSTTKSTIFSTKETKELGTLPPKPIFPSKWSTKSETVQPPQKHKKEESGGLSLAGGVGIIVVSTLLIGAVIGGIYWIRRKHEVARQKLSDDSDIRYLKDDEIHIDFTEARPQTEMT